MSFRVKDTLYPSVPVLVYRSEATERLYPAPVIRRAGAFCVVQVLDGWAIVVQQDDAYVAMASRREKASAFDLLERLNEAVSTFSVMTDPGVRYEVDLVFPGVEEYVKSETES